MNNVRQRRNNFVIFNVEFHNFEQRRKNIANMIIYKKIKNKPRIKSKMVIFELQIKTL